MKTIKMTITNNRVLALEIQKALEKNGGYCPCKLEKTIDTMCPCLEFREQDAPNCGCGLYVKELQ